MMMSFGLSSQIHQIHDLRNIRLVQTESLQAIPAGWAEASPLRTHDQYNLHSPLRTHDQYYLHSQLRTHDQYYLDHLKSRRNMGSAEGQVHGLDIGIGVVQEMGWDILENTDEALPLKKCLGLVGSTLSTWDRAG